MLHDVYNMYEFTMLKMMFTKQQLYIFSKLKKYYAEVMTPLPHLSWSSVKYYTGILYITE